MLAFNMNLNPTCVVYNNEMETGEHILICSNSESFIKNFVLIVHTTKFLQENKYQKVLN